MGEGPAGFDLKDAYAAVRQNATENDGWGWAGRDHLHEYIAKGYIPMDARKKAATSCTLEYAYDDYCVSRLAKAMGKQEDFQLFSDRSHNYRHVWYALMKLLGGREAMAKKLDELLSMPTTSVVGTYGHKIHEMREVEHGKMGQYAHVNEPCHHVLCFYNHVRQP